MPFMINDILFKEIFDLELLINVYFLVLFSAAQKYQPWFEKVF